MTSVREDERDRERHHRERQGSQGAFRRNQEKVAVDRSDRTVSERDLAFD
jgi:hypothetical protein